MTGLDLLTRALRTIGALESGEVPSSDEAADGLVSLNDLLDSWNAERLMVFTVTIDEFTLTPSQQVYTYGTGGNFNAPRPVRIDRASIVSLTNPAQPLELPIDYVTDQEWQLEYPVKVIPTTLPLAVYDDQNFPLRNLSYWPIPTVAVKTRLYVWTALNSFPDLTTDITFPPAYSRALRYNLAQELAPEYGLPMSAEAAAAAVQSKSVVRLLNVPEISSYCDPALSGDPGHYNFYSDTPVGGTRK
jgi:hypothetical protein